jgi:hypothetical protein
MALCSFNFIKLLDNIGKLKCRPRYHSVTVEKNGDGKIEKISISRNEKAIKKEMSICGFFSSVSYKASGDALQMLKAYKTRDEQEKYFEQMKDQMDFHTQDASSQDGRAGREFILFVGLILSSAVRNTWSRNVVLRENFRTSLSILDEMQDIRWVRFADGREHMTEFCGLQVLICEQFGLTAPAECLPSQERKAAERKQNPKKRGRKPKGTPASNKLKVSPS